MLINNTPKILSLSNEDDFDAFFLLCSYLLQNIAANNVTFRNALNENTNSRHRQ